MTGEDQVSVRSFDPMPLQQRRTIRLSWPSIYMFAFGFGWALTLELQFRIYLAEVVVLALLPLLRWQVLFVEYRALPRVLTCLALWLVAIVISDLFNQTDPINTLRALSTPLLASASLVFALACIHSKSNSLLGFFVGTALGKMVFGEPFYGTEWAERAIDLGSLGELNYFKARIEPFLTPVLLVSLAWLGRNQLRRVILPASIIGIAYVLLDARSVGLFFLATSGVLVLLRRGRRISPAAFAIGGVLLSGMLYALFLAYVDYTLRENATSQTGRQLVRVENPYNPLELLRVGRSEWTVMPDAISERPVMGWGSWAEDANYRFSTLRLERSRDLNQGVEQFGGITYIPAHSVVGATWMWSGLLGLAAMIWLAVVLVRLGFAATAERTILLFLTLFLSAHMVWAFIFSPPQSVRTQFPVAMAMLIYLGSASSGLRVSGVSVNVLARMRP